MRFVAFTHSLVSDWNHGNAHFLRGIAGEFVARGWNIRVLESRDGWSRKNLIEQHGDAPIKEFEAAFPALRSELYDPASSDLDDLLDDVLSDADIVLVHEWNDPLIVSRIGRHRAATGGDYQLFFHDTHHRMITSPESMGSYDLQNYDGVLAYGRVLRNLYLSRNWAQNAWTWHEAADIHTFYPRISKGKQGDLVWIGNWGDDERADELREFLIRPVKRLGLKATVYGVRYPDSALQELADAGIEYGGWLPNYRVPEVFSRFKVTVHVPRRPYAAQLAGIPTIRPFEAMACGIPLISAPWQDCENLFRTGRDYLSAQNGDRMTELLGAVLSDKKVSDGLIQNGLATIVARHTCAHRVDQLLEISQQLKEEVAVGGRV